MWKMLLHVNQKPMMTMMMMYLLSIFSVLCFLPHHHIQGIHKFLSYVVLFHLISEKDRRGQSSFYSHVSEEDFFCPSTLTMPFCSTSGA